VATVNGGMIVSLNAKLGEKVTANQVVARVAQPTLLEQIRLQRLEVEQAGRDRAEALRLASNDAKLKQEALELQRANATREIEEIEAQVRLASEQIPVLDQLLAKGLVTKQQTINARQTVVSLQQQISARRAAIKQYDAQRYEIEAESQQVDSDRMAKIRHLQNQVADLEKQLTISENVVSPYNGDVIEMKVDAGSVVPPLAPLLSIQPEEDNLEALVCVPSRFAKDVAPDMDAEIAPSPIKREEFGFIRGKVVYVAAYPATSASLMRSFQNDKLVQTLMAAGPVTEVKVRMARDTTTLSGFQWSSSKGPPFHISSGALATVQIITNRRRPISLLLPFVKKKLGIS
jgi:HlyD family secretion protein